MSFYSILCLRSSTAPEDSSFTVVKGYFSIISRRYYYSEMYIMSQSFLSYLRIDIFLLSTPTSYGLRSKRIPEIFDLSLSKTRAH